VMSIFFLTVDKHVHLKWSKPDCMAHQLCLYTACCRSHSSCKF
jgi:hypothetical protein